MLRINGRWRHPFCDGLSRRSFLRVGGLGLGGLALPSLLQAEAAAGIRQSHKAVIMVYLPGGPPHLDLYDLKPEAPAEVRGEFKPIATAVPGIVVCEHLPRMAALMDKLVLIRSIVGAEDRHASFQCLTGRPTQNPPAGGWPCLGAVISRAQGPVGPAVPPFASLTPTMKVGYVRSEAALALGKIGAGAKAAVPRLIELMKDADEGVRLAAGIAIRDLGPEARAAVSTLLEAQNDWHSEVRGIAHEALGKIGPAAIPELTEALQSKNAHIRSTVASALGTFGPAAKPAVPALLAAVKDKYWGTRRQAILALGKIDPAAAGLARLLTEALRDDKTGRVRDAAAVTLGSLEKHKDIAIPALTAALKDKDDWVRLAVAQSLWKLQPGERRVVEVLIGLVNNSEPDVRNSAAALLKSIDPKAAKEAGVR